MNSSRLELVHSIVTDGFDAHSSDLSALIAEARLRRVNEILLDVVADADAPRVARERALGRVIVALAHNHRASNARHANNR